MKQEITSAVSPSTSTAILNTRNLHDELVSGMIEFMALIGVEEMHLNPLNAAIIAESVHRAQVGFWQSFRTDMIVEAFDRHMPTWRNLPPNKLMGFTTHQFIRELEKQVRINAFDEANAALFLDLPEGNRPVDANSAYERICWQVDHFGSLDDCRQLDESGIRAGSRAYELYLCLEAAKRHKVRLTSLGEEVKRCRDAAKRRQEKNAGKKSARHRAKH